MKPSLINYDNGYIALLTVLIISAGMTAAALSLLFLGVLQTRTILVVQQSAQARALADACVERALQNIRDSVPYVGSDSFLLGEGSCSYTVTSQGGQNRTIVSSGVVDLVVRKVVVIISSINPSIQIVSWQEVDNF